MTGAVHIAAMGLCCPVGLGLGPAYAAIRAGIRRFADSPYATVGGEPIVCSALASLPTALRRKERLTSLLALAIADAARSFTPAQLAEMPLFLGTADPQRPGAVLALTDSVLDRLSVGHGLRFRPRLTREITGGSTAGLRALAEARALLETQPEVAGCVVASGDSLVNASTLAWLDADHRLKCEDNSDGVIPGEAAACVVITRKPWRGLHPGVHLRGLDFSREVATRSADAPLRGEGLVDAARRALGQARLELADIDLRLSDAGGEGYAFKELTIALCRSLRTRRDQMPLWLPAEALGDTGAAAGLVALVLGSAATFDSRRAYARVLVYAADVAEERAAAVITAASSDAQVLSALK